MTELLTVRDAAAVFRVTDDTIRNWASRGDLPAIRLQNGRLRFRSDVIERIIADTAVPTITRPAKS